MYQVKPCEIYYRMELSRFLWQKEVGVEKMSIQIEGERRVAEVEKGRYDKLVKRTQ